MAGCTGVSVYRIRLRNPVSYCLTCVRILAEVTLYLYSSCNDLLLCVPDYALTKDIEKVLEVNLSVCSL